MPPLTVQPFLVPANICREEERRGEEHKQSKFRPTETQLERGHQRIRSMITGQMSDATGRMNPKVTQPDISIMVRLQ